MTKFKIIVTFLFLLAHNLIWANDNSRKLFNKDWKFYKICEPKEINSDFSSLDIDLSRWESVTLPHSANIEPLITENQWQGLCWYRKKFDLHNFSSDKSYFIEFEALMNIAEIWVNGQLIKKDQGGYLPTVIDISEVVKPSNNVIALRLDNRDNPITGPKPLKILDFNMYGGIYRNAWIYEEGKTYITNPNLVDRVAGGGVFVTTPTVSKNMSVVNIKTNIANDLEKDRTIKIIQKICNKRGKIVNRYESEILVAANSYVDSEIEMELVAPLLWSPNDPNLYTLTTEIYDEKVLLDSEVTSFGIREFIFKGNDLYINGEKSFLPGVNRHQEYPYIGYALSDRAQYRDAYKIKSAGFDYVRLSHYPHSPAFMDACDQLGLVVVDAILGWQYFNKDPLFTQHAYDSARRLIRRDRNHPSVLAWEVSLNETGMSKEFMKNLHEIVHSEYPAEKGVYSCGWRFGEYDIFLQARQHRILHKQSVNFERPYMVSEYGDWEFYSSDAGFSQHTLPADLRFEQSSRQLRSSGEKGLRQQALNLQQAHNDNLSIPAYGDAYWVMFDYNRGSSNNLESSGVMDIFRLPKFSYDFYRSQRDMESKHELVLSFASYWNEDSNESLIIYSNCDEVELYINRKLVARQRADSDVNSKNLKHPPFTFKAVKFESGELKAVAYCNGKKVGARSISTAKKVERLKCWVDVSGKNPKSDCNDVIFLYVAAIDENGTIVNDYEGEISLNLPTNFKLLNHNGTIKAEAGIATALLQVGDEDGKFNVALASEDGYIGKGIIKVE